MLNKIIRGFKNPNQVLMVMLRMKIFRLLNDKSYLEIQYRLRIGKKLDLNKPKSFNEKLQWLKLYNRNTEYTKLVDKYEVRNYISEILGEEYLVPLIGVWNKFDDINFENLPEKFVLKSTNDSGGVVICSDKNEFNIELARKKINKSLNTNFYYTFREWPYKNVTPRIICETYLQDFDRAELIDYKFMCFNGRVKCIFVCSNRGSEKGINIDVYDTEWELLPFERANHGNSEKKLLPPINLNRMIQLAENLSKDVPFIRIDFYEVKNKIYFGEMTFFPSSGLEKFNPEHYDYIVGSWLTLPQKKVV